jgi:hypothetical protein
VIWVLVAALGFAAWLLVAWFVLALCRAAARADAVTTVAVCDRRLAFDRATGCREAQVIDLCALRAAYLSSRDSRRSLSSLPSVWQVGQ